LEKSLTAIRAKSSWSLAISINALRTTPKEVITFQRIFVERASMACGNTLILLAILPESRLEK
jgi:hypothetical protein